LELVVGNDEGADEVLGEVSHGEERENADGVVLGGKVVGGHDLEDGVAPFLSIVASSVEGVGMSSDAISAPAIPYLTVADLGFTKDPIGEVTKEVHEPDKEVGAALEGVKAREDADEVGLRRGKACVADGVAFRKPVLGAEGFLEGMECTGDVGRIAMDAEAYMHVKLGRVTLLEGGVLGVDTELVACRDNNEDGSNGVRRVGSIPGKEFNGREGFRDDG